MHPLAWWAWALGLVVATTRTTNPVVIGLLVAAATLVVMARREDAPWGRAFRWYLLLGGCIVVVRVLFYVVVGVKTPGLVLLDLPRVPLPDWAVAVELFGPVTLTGLLMAVYAGVRLAALVICFGAANALANPRRALRSLPAALHQLSTAVVIAMSVTPQLVTSAAQVRQAQRLRGTAPRGLRSLPAVALPVLTDALDRSVALAASMDSRGYARAVPGTSDRRVSALLLGALVAAVLGTYGLLDGTSPTWLGLPVLLLGAGAATIGGLLAGRRVRRTRYRPDRWDLRASLVACCGVVAAGLLVAVTATDPAALDPSLSPLGWPSLPPVALLAVLVAAAPAVLAPAPAPSPAVEPTRTARPLRPNTPHAPEVAR